MRFITGWLSREQDKGKLNPNKPQKETSMDLSAYEDMVSGYIPVYERDVSGWPTQYRVYRRATTNT